jgi:hypothetical protein
MKRLGLARVVLCAAVVLGSAGVLTGLLTSCGSPPPALRPVVQPGAVPDDRVREGLDRTIRAGTPLYYKMPIDEALAILGPPYGELRDTVILRRFERTKGARAYYWQTASTTLYVVVDRREKLVRNVIIVDDDTNVGNEVLVTRAEVLSLRITPGMGVGEALKIMGQPTRFEETRTGEGGPVSRLIYEPADDIAPAVIIEVDSDKLVVIHVSTASREEFGPPEGY